MRSYAVGLSRPPHDVTDGGIPPRAATDLDELLATLAEAPDLPSSAAFLLSRLGELSGSGRGYVRLLDPTAEVLTVVARVGFEDDEPREPLSVNDLSHPIVLSALSLHPVWCNGRGAGDGRIPFREWIALPLPRGDDRTGPPLLSGARVVDLLGATGLHVGPRPTRQQEWFGRAPAGVVVLEGLPNEETVEALARRSE